MRLCLLLLDEKINRCKDMERELEFSEACDSGQKTEVPRLRPLPYSFTLRPEVKARKKRTR